MEEENTKEGMNYRPPLGGQEGPTGISRVRLSPIRCLILVQVLELATGLGVLSQRTLHQHKDRPSIYFITLLIDGVTIKFNNDLKHWLYSACDQVFTTCDCRAMCA